jgi:hypothetical protein
MRRLLPLAICCLLAASAAGCGTKTSAGNFRGEQAAVAKVVDDLSNASSRHDTSTICDSLLAADVAKRLGNCKTVIGHQLDNVDNFDVTVQSVAINGSRAQARVKSTANGKSELDTLNLVKGRDGRWRIQSLG